MKYSINIFAKNGTTIRSEESESLIHLMKVLSSDIVRPDIHSINVQSEKDKDINSYSISGAFYKLAKLIEKENNELLAKLSAMQNIDAISEREIDHLKQRLSKSKESCAVYNKIIEDNANQLLAKDNVIKLLKSKIIKLQSRVLNLEIKEIHS